MYVAMMDAASIKLITLAVLQVDGVPCQCCFLHITSPDKLYPTTVIA
jgi:hypothetical protein